MTFYSPWAGFQLVLTPATFKTRRFAGEDYDSREPDFGVTIKFSPIPGGGFKSPKYGALRGRAKVEDTNVINRIKALINDGSIGTNVVMLGGIGDVIPEDTFYQEAPDGSIYCELCEQVLANTQAWAGHKRSKVHQERVAEAQAKRAAELGEEVPVSELESLGEGTEVARHSSQGGK